MLINKMGKSFGPGASVSGQILFVFGLVISFFSLKGLILAVIGAFIGFTRSSAQIDEKNRRIRQTSDFFGIIPVGKWISCYDDMSVTLRKIRQRWQINSISNKSTSIDESGWELLLFTHDGKPVAPVGRAEGREEAEILRKKITSMLGIKEY